MEKNMKDLLSQAVNTLTKAIELLDQAKDTSEPGIEERKEFTPPISNSLNTAENKEMTFTEVREILANISRNGYTTGVRAILLKYGTDRLSALDKTHYEAVIEEARCLGATREDIELAIAQKLDEGLEQEIQKVFDHHNLTSLRNLKEEHYPVFLRDIRRLSNG